MLMSEQFARKIIRCMRRSDIQEEIKATAILFNNPHENIVTVLEYGVQETQFYINMEYCHFTLGEYTAGDEVTRSAGLMVWRGTDIETQIKYIASHVMYDLAKGIVFLHERGLVHRDLSPDNGMS